MLDIKHIKTVTHRPQANLTERVNRTLVQMIASFLEENHDNWDRFLHEFSFVLRTAVNETTEYVGGNIEELFDEARQNMQRQHKTREKYYNRKRRAVNIKVNDLVLVQTHFISAAGRRVVGKFMPKFEGPYRVLEVQNNNLTIWKRGRRSQSNKGNVGLEDLRVKRNRRVVTTGTSERYDRKRPKICRKRSLQGSDYETDERKAPVLPQGLKRGVLSSISSRTYKHIRKNTNKNPSQGPEILPGTSNQGQMKRFSPTKEESRREARLQSDRARETRTTGSKGHSAAAGRPVRSRRKPRVRPCPYYLKSRFKKPEGLPEEH
ncbi:uncharacterized protein TNCV_2030491 [Trichonephila clavipes]|nr:uncharacterized protein TNCV_2030491 [Trichonephila clavipes]